MRAAAGASQYVLPRLLDVADGEICFDIAENALGVRQRFPRLERVERDSPRLVAFSVTGLQGNHRRGAVELVSDH